MQRIIHSMTGPKQHAGSSHYQEELAICRSCPNPTYKDREENEIIKEMSMHHLYL